MRKRNAELVEAEASETRTVEPARCRTTGAIPNGKMVFGEVDYIFNEWNLIVETCSCSTLRWVRQLALLLRWVRFVLERCQTRQYKLLPGALFSS